MKSIAIKTNNTKVLDYLLLELNSCDISDIYFSKNIFKNYENIIIHYIGNNNLYFISKISLILSFLVTDELEEEILKDYIKINYFYFTENELSKILTNCFDILAEDFSFYFNKKFDILNLEFSKYLENNKVLILSGFINFRLKNYFDVLEDIITEAVTRFVVEKEYLEFISMLQGYISTKPETNTLLHLIYTSHDSTLLDENMKLILNTKSSFDSKFLSDISFSSNDYTLNSLLSIIPSKIIIHLTDNTDIDEFINTILLVFGNRVKICKNCNICSNNIIEDKNTKKSNLNLNS